MDNIKRLIEKASVRERALRAEAIRQAFHQTDDAGNPVARSPQDFAANLGLPPQRCANILKNAIRDTPMPGDPEPVDIIYEDDFIIVVNKPPFLRSQPIHRHIGGSVLNRLITYLGSPPHVRSITSLSTSVISVYSNLRYPLRALTFHSQ